MPQGGIREKLLIKMACILILSPKKILGGKDKPEAEHERSLRLNIRNKDNMQ